MTPGPEPDRQPRLTRIKRCVVKAARAINWWRVGFASGIMVVGFVATCFYDEPVYRYFKGTDHGEHEMHRMLRLMGYMPAWAVLGVAIMLHDLPIARVKGWKAALDRGLFVLLVPVMSGVGAELLKLLLRRERPEPHDGEYIIRPFLERTFDGGNLGLPSSHTAVAFGGALALTWLSPRTGPVWLLLAVGCAFTRVSSTAHFLSDAWLGAALAFACLRVVVHWHQVGQNEPKLI